MVAVGAGLVGAAAVSGCGGSGSGHAALRDDAVARVGDAVISHADFERALRFASGAAANPRDFAACARTKQRESATRELGTAGLVAQCKQEYERLKDGVMEFLIKSEWTRQEAGARNVRLTDTQMEQAVDRAEEAGLLGARALSQAGLTEQQLIQRLRQSRLESKVTELVTASARDISERDVANYYRRKRSELALPERRDLRIVITRAEAPAKAARAAVEGGQSWRSVAAEYSLHSSRNQAGKVENARRGSNRKVGLGAAIFGARTGELTGPVRDRGAWAVFVVEKIKPAYQPTLEQARAEIEKTLASTQKRQALETYIARYREITTCASGFEVSACGNGSS
jgi:foldase protein PrsA